MEDSSETVRSQDFIVKYEELFISRFIRCKDSLNEHSSVNLYRLYPPSYGQVIFNRALSMSTCSLFAKGADENK
jgi:hypothetical protein